MFVKRLNEISFSCYYREISILFYSKTIFVPIAAAAAAATALLNYVSNGIGKNIKRSFFSHDGNFEKLNFLTLLNFGFVGGISHATAVKT